jgi:UDP-3-O-[3-hydroxymyristoyl] glucosamine N-acyltransferase
MQRQAKLINLAKITTSKFKGDADHIISGVNTLEKASSLDVSFLANDKYIEMANKSKAGILCIHEKHEKELLSHGAKNFLICQDPSKTFQAIVEYFAGNKSQVTGFTQTNIHPSSTIHKTAQIDKDAIIMPSAVIDMGAKIGKNTIVGAGVYVGIDAVIGSDCVLYANSVVRENCELKNRVILQPGCVIGSCGFGYTLNEKNEFEKLSQIGNVILEDDVEIGANTAIDRARFQHTIIKKGTKIDNLVQIAHNVQVGQNSAIAAQSGIAGSSKIGNYVMMGGQCGIVGHVDVGDFIKLATRAGVSKSLKKKAAYRGSPAIDISEYNNQKIHVRRLSKYVDRIKALEEKIENLEKKLADQ